jgi:hypothetical protein
MNYKALNQPEQAVKSSVDRFRLEKRKKKVK